MRVRWGLLGAIAIAIVSASAASAATFTVNVASDGLGDCDPAGGGNCTLRQAILDANEQAGPHVIRFSIGSGLRTIMPIGPLPSLESSATVIRGNTQPGSGTTPRIELDGSLAGAGSPGLEIRGDAADVLGLAINDFGGPGILVNGADDTVIQGNYLGTDDAAAVAEPNQHGVRIVHQLDAPGGIDPAIGTRIGGEPGEGNVISGNDVGGVSIEAPPIASLQARGTPGVPEQIEVEGNMIGTDATGLSPIGNGLVGVEVDAEAVTIGDTDDQGPGLSNVIAHNGADGGVAVLAGEDIVIAANRIFSNAGLGIDLAAAGVADGVTPNDGVPDSDAGANGLQNHPVLDAVATQEDGTLQAITGTLFTAPGSYEALFYVGDECDPSGNGEGQRLIGSETIVTDASGEGNFSVIPQGAAGARVFPGEQVTVTIAGGEGTSEFSPCLQAAPPSVAGEQVVAGPVGSGSVLVKAPGSDEFQPLVDPERIEEGSVLNTKAGAVRIVSEAPTEPGGTREAIFSRGKFKLTQANQGHFTTTARLQGGNPCNGAKRARAAGVNKVLTKGRRRHRSRGRHAAGTVRGTEWLTAERCGGTYFEVFEGTVVVNDFERDRKVRLDAGESYLAKNRP